jgi:hypothetical protein
MGSTLEKNDFYIDTITNFGYPPYWKPMKVPKTLPALNRSPYGKQRIVAIKKPTSTYLALWRRYALQKKPDALQINQIRILF